MKIAPSMLACDFSMMGEEIRRLENAGCDMIHMDIMDGHFVPNISFGPAVIKSLRGLCSLPFDTHLMISHPLDYIKTFVQSGSNIITFHIESSSNTGEVIDKIHSFGKKAGLSIKPGTSQDAIIPYLDRIDLILVMTVEPGFGGQKFMYNRLATIEYLSKKVKETGRDIIIEVDGGINLQTATLVSKAGADVCVAGTSIFRAQDIKTAILEYKAIK